MKRRDPSPDPSIARHLIQAALALSVLAVPFVWTREVFSIYTLPKLLLLALAAVFAWSAALTGRGSAGRAGRLVERAFAAAWLVLLLSAWGSVDLYTSLFGRYNDYAYGLLAMTLYTLAFFWGVGFSKEDRRRFGLWAVYGAGLVGLFGIAQKLGIRPLLDFPLPGGRAVSTIGSPVHLGGYLAGALALAIPIDGESRRGVRWLCALGIAAGLIASLSRGAWIAAACGVCVVFARTLLSRLPVKTRNRSLVAVLLAALLAAAVGVSAVLISRFRSVRDSDSLRMEAWRASLSMIAENPLLGSGPDTFGVEFRKRKSAEFVRIGGPGLRHEHAHNDLLQAATTTGLAGIFVYLGLLLAIGIEFSRRWKHAPEQPRGEALRLAGGVVAFFIVGKFNPMSTEILFLSALAAGSALASLEARKADSPTQGVVFAGAAWCAAAVVLCLSGWLFVGDYFSQQGRLRSGADALNAQKRASRFNPCETQYARRYINTLLDLARENIARPQRFEYLDAARDSIARTSGCRSGAIEARYMAGFVALLEAQLGRPERIVAAERELDAAIALDPTFPAVLTARAAAARTAKDPVRAKEFEARAAALTSR